MNNNIKTTITNGIIYLSICNIHFILDDEQIEYIMNTNKKWIYEIHNDKYPYYISHNIKKNLIEFLYGKEIEINIKNNNIYDLRKNNINIKINKHKYQDIINKYYINTEYNQGHIINGKFYNPYWTYLNSTNDKIYIILCSSNYLVELSDINYNKIIEYEKNINQKLTLCYTYIKNRGYIYYQYKTKQIFINSIIDNFDIDNIKYIDSLNNINVLTPEIAKQIYISKKSGNINFIKKIERKNKEHMKQMDIDVKKNYNLLKTYRGHINKLGTDAFVEKNRMWKIYDKDKNKNILLMYCEPGKLIELCKKSLKIIKEFEKNNTGKLTWYFHPNGYIQGSNNLYIHQIITGCYGNGRGTMDISVDHINRDPLNNCFDNLHVATREEQQENTKSSDGERRARSKSAKPLPEGITNDMMKKYVVYYKECYNKDKQLYREFFKIEKHPKLEKPWISSKSKEISIFDKLKSANDMIDTLA